MWLPRSAHRRPRRRSWGRGGSGRERGFTRACGTMTSTSESQQPSTSPRHVPLDFNDWSVRPMPLDTAKHGERAGFWDNFHGSPTVVGRTEFNEHEDGCIAYTKFPIPSNTAWRIELLETTDCWQRGLVSFAILIVIHSHLLRYCLLYTSCIKKFICWPSTFLTSPHHSIV